jgi:hypothetical protein
MQMDHKHAYTLRMTHLCNRSIANVATVRNVEVILDIYNVYLLRLNNNAYKKWNKVAVMVLVNLWSK